MKFSSVQKLLMLAVLSLLFFFAADAFAQTVQKASTIGDVASNITSTFGNLAKLITAISYIAGMGFGLASILKFKAHKDNPTQIPIGTPIALLFVAAALLFLPSLFGIAGQSIFGEGATTGGISGVTSF